MLACMFCMCAWLWVALPPSHTATTTPIHRCAATGPALLKWLGCNFCPKLRPTHPPTFSYLNMKKTAFLKPNSMYWHTHFHTCTTHALYLGFGQSSSVLVACTPRDTSSSFASHHNGVCATHCCHSPFHTSATPAFPLAFGRVPVLLLHIPLGTHQLLLLPTTMVCVCHTSHTCNDQLPSCCVCVFSLCGC